MINQGDIVFYPKGQFPTVEYVVIGFYKDGTCRIRSLKEIESWGIDIGDEIKQDQLIKITGNIIT